MIAGNGLALWLIRPPPSDRPLFAVSTSILHAAIHDLYSDQVRVHVIVPPGACPGHYDMKPDDLARLAEADLIIIHDYQEPLRKKLSSAGLRLAPVVMIEERGSLVTPPGYKKLLAAVAEEVQRRVPEFDVDSTVAIKHASSRVDEYEAEARAKWAGRVSGRKVAAAHFQAEFCRYWGAQVAVEIPPPGDLSARGLAEIMDQAREAKVQAVVGNAQSGQKEFEVIADRLGVPLIMLSNFPQAGKDAPSYWQLLNSNLEALANGAPHD